MLTPERRAELRADAENRRLFRFVTGTASDGYPSSGYEPIDADLAALLDAADERDRLLTVADTLGRVNGEYAMEIHRCREALGVDEDTDPHHAAQALAAAVGRVRALHVADGEGFCRCCDYMTPHPCPTLRALDGADDHLTPQRTRCIIDP